VNFPKATAFATVAVIIVGSCGGQPTKRPPAQLQVVEVSVDLDCSRVQAEDSCDVDAFVEVRNDGPQDVVVRACAISRDGQTGIPHSLRNELALEPNETGIAKVESGYAFSYDFSKKDLLATRSWDAECRTSLPRISAPVQKLFEIELQCANDFFSIGPNELAEIYELPVFDAATVAERYGKVNLFEAGEVEACKQAFSEAQTRYERARLNNWAPYRTEELWRWRWDRYYICALAVWDDYRGPARQLLQGAISVTEAARAYSFETLPQPLQQPGYDGCLPGLRLGLRLREQSS
jgi:hypothetical protein